MSRKLSVLFVDDEPNILRAVRRHTRQFRDQWDMHFAYGGVDAVKVITRESIDIVVTDMRMPEVDGSQLLEWISENHPEMVRIVLSGEAKLDEIYRIVGRSHRFLAKPCSPDALVSVLTEVVDAQLCDQVQNGDFKLSMLDNLTTPQSCFDELQAVINSDEPSLDDLAESIRRDPSLSLRILQLANSAYFKQAANTCSIRKAVSHIGVDRLRDLLQGGRLGQESRTNIDDTQMPEAAFWLARAAQNSSRVLTDNPEAISAAYVAGLSLRCGAVDLHGTLAKAAMRAVFLSVLLGLPEILTKALRRLSKADGDIPFEQWPRLIAEALAFDKIELLDGEVAA